MNNIYSINYLKIIFYLCTALFFNLLGAEQESNNPYYDNCGTYDNNSNNDCTQDCFGRWGGDATIDECGVCGGNGPKENEDCAGNCLIEIDCFGICGGLARLDDCSKCDEDPTNDCKKSYFDNCGNFDDNPDNDCIQDCSGVWGGINQLDDCDICGGNNSTCGDCAGVAYGSAYYDNCNVCDDNPINDCIQDCDGQWGGNNKLDNCGICGGDNSTCEDCAGNTNGSAYYDNCSICDDNPDNDCIKDCNGEWGGKSFIDECGVCGGKGIPQGYCDCNLNILDCMGICGGNSLAEDCFLEENPSIVSNLNIDFIDDIYFSRTIRYYILLNGVVDPFYKDIKGLAFASEYRPNSYHGLNFTKELRKLSKKTELGYDGKTIITSLRYGTNDIVQPSIASVDYYKLRTIDINNYEKMKEVSFNQISPSIKSSRNSKKLTLVSQDIGETNVAINLSGQIEIRGELEFINSQSTSLSNQNNESWNLDIDQKQRFDLEGQVGDRLTISADQNSESDFDFENSLLLDYKGYDNEIINNIQAGNIGISLSEGSLFSVGMGKRAGVFGVKMSSQLGPIEFNTIIGREKVKKESFSLGNQSEGLDRYDYQFIKDKYFFIDKIFKNNFYPLNEDYINEIGSNEYVIKDFKLYKRAQTNEIETDIYEGVAYIDPLDKDIGTPENNIWIELEDQYSGNDYYINKYYGYVRLNSISTSDLIAVHYTIGDLNNDGSILESSNPIQTGTEYLVQDRCLLSMQDDCNEETINGCSEIEASTLEVCTEDNNTNCCNYIEYNNLSGFSADPLILKIIKTEGQQDPPSPDNPNGNPTWELMMKNVYDIGLSNFTQGDEPPEIDIIHIGGQLGTETASSNGNTFLRIFGIDNKDSQGFFIANGDGKVDSYFINSWGDLFLPFDMPFVYDPEAYLGNPHLDLVDIFDGDLESINIETLSTTRENGDAGPEFTIYRYEDGPAMYYSSNETTKASEKEFVIKVKNVNQNTTINLGFMIVEGSETLTDGSTQLIKGVDYSVDYFTGTLTLISDRAKNNSQTLRISYDRNEIVSFDQKLIFGNSFKYDINNKSNLFGGLYFYKQSITDNKVEIGYEPMENMIWHLGGKYSKELLNLNNSVNNKGLVYLEKPSEFSFSTEVAQIFPNPNPIGIAYIDDFESSKRYSTMPILNSAWQESSPPYKIKNIGCLSAATESDCLELDDCEINYNEYNEFLSCEVVLEKYDIYKRENVYWYNPYNDIPTELIWPDKEVEEASKEQTLWLEIPENKTGGNVNDGNDNKWWNGITASLYASDQNQSNNKYLDIWLNYEGLIGFENHYNGLPENPILVNRNNLKLNIDIGMISEDTNDNGILDTEDLVPESLMIMGDGLLDAGEDKGMDACINEYEDGWGGCLCSEFNHGNNNDNTYNSCIDDSQLTFSQIKTEVLSGNSNYDNVININVSSDDPNNDDFSYTLSSNDFSHYNGTENNGAILENKYPDSEDLNGDQFIDDINSYYSYTINLDMNNNDIIQSEILSTNWKLFRIPLNDFIAINETSGYSADWTNVKNIRLWLEGEYSENDTHGLLGIASIEIVGNEWEELGLVNNDDIGQVGYLESEFVSNEDVSIQLINNQENSDIYDPPEGVSGNNQNFGTGGLGSLIVDKEQSLVIDFNSVSDYNGGISLDSTAFIKKNVSYSSLDAEKQNSFFVYKNLEMYFNGNESTNGQDWYSGCNGVENEECSNVELCFRFGKDDNYYEIRKPFKSIDNEDVLDPNGWQNLMVNLDELTRYKLNRQNLESYNDNGIDNCDDSYETGIINSQNNIPGCLNQDAIDLGITTLKICDEISGTSVFTDEQISYCNENDCLNFIDSDICLDENYDELGLYIPYILDPNGDNYYIPGVECCDSNVDNENFCIPDINNIDNPNFYCPDLSDIYYLGTEGNNQYDCFDENNESCGEDDLIFYGEEVIDDWDQNSLYTTPGSYIAEDEIWSWKDYCESNENLDIEECDDWTTVDISTVCEDCSELRVKGEPAINKMEYIMVGIKNNAPGTIFGSVWINELRMTGVKRKKGTAFTTNFKFNLGDVFNIDLDFKSEEADFHRLEQRLGSGDHSINYSVNLGFSPHELFKENYFQMPLTIKYSKGLYSPLYKPGSDIILGGFNDTPDEFKNITNSITLSTSLNTMFSNYYSENLFFKHLLDNSKFTYSYKWDQSSNTTILNKESILQNIKFDYSLSFSRENKWYPFKNIFEDNTDDPENKKYFVNFLKDLNIYYTPQNISFNSSIVDSDNYTVQRDLYGGIVTDEENIDLNRTFSSDINIVDNLSLKYSVNMKNNLNDYFSDNSAMKISDFFDLSYSPGIKKSYNQQLSFTYTPEYLKWLAPRFTYVPTYNWVRDAVSGESSTADISSDNKFSVSFTFSFTQFIEQFYETDKKTSGSSSRSTGRRRSSSSTKNTNSSKIFIINQPHFKTILKFFHEIGQRFSSVNINYSYYTTNKYNNISTDINPDYKFKLGIVDRPIEGSLFTSSDGIIISSSNTFNQELKFSTSIQLTQNLTLSNVEYRVSLSANNQSDSGYNETQSESYFPLGPSGKNGFPIFGWSINLRGLEKYQFLDNWFKSFSLSHTFSGEKNKISQDFIVQKLDYKRNFAPLLRFDMTTKKVPLDIDLTLNNTLNITNEGGQIERTINNQISLTFGYRKKTGFRMPVFFLRDFQIENEINLSLKLGYDNSNTEFSYFETNDLSQFEVIAYSNSYNLQPKITYNFSKFVEGDLWFNYIVSDNHTSGRKKETDIGFQVRIYFESFD